MTSRSRNVTPSRRAMPGRVRGSCRPPRTRRRPGERGRLADARGGARHECYWLVVWSWWTPCTYWLTIVILRLGHRMGLRASGLEAGRGEERMARYGERAQGGDAAADHRGGRSPVQARRHRRLRGRDAHGGRRPDQRRLLRPLRLEGGPRRERRRRPAARAAREPEALAARPRRARAARPRVPVAEHRDDPEGGCPSAALLDEIGRCVDATKQAYTEGQLAVIDDIAARLAPDDPSRHACRRSASSP